MAESNFYTPNPFLDAASFQAARKQLSPAALPTNGTVRDGPNPFTHTKSYLEMRGLTARMSEHTAPIPPTMVVDSLPDPALSDDQASPLSDAAVERPLDPKHAGNPFADPEHFQKVKEFTSAHWSALNEAIGDLALVEVIAELHGIGNQDGDPTKYKIRGENVIINGQLWHSKNSDEGGGGAISLVQYFEDLTRRDDAVRWLADRFKSRLGTDALKHSLRNHIAKEKPTFEPPESASEFLNLIRDYLHLERGIDLALIDRLVSEGRVYADTRRNVVMISKQGQLAELRGVEAYRDRTGEWKTTKMLKPGSDKSSGAFMVIVDKDKIRSGTIKSEKTLAVVEAGIDAMSYHMLHPGRDVFSASGASFNFPRKSFFDAYNNGRRFHCAFDADQAGDKASQNIYNSAALYWHFKHTAPFSSVVQTTDDFLSLLNRKVVRLKLTPELGDHQKDEMLAEVDEDELESGLSQNVLFFNEAQPFSDPNRPPKIFFSVKSNSLGFPTGKHELTITPDLYKTILTEFGLSRDRPQNAKDWNELVKPKPKNMPKFT
jgi:Toprim-like